MGKRIRVLVAKPGLDGHDRGAKIVAIALKNAGMEVIYSGLHQSIDAIVTTAIQEDVDIIGLSIMTGGHIRICRMLQEELKAKDVSDIIVTVGGVIPKRDFAELEAMGIHGIFPGGTALTQTIEFIQKSL